MTHYPPARKEPYAGPIIDGPHAGDWLESYGWHEVLYWQQPTIVAPYGSIGLNTGIDIHQIFYVWLPSYRAWAWNQPEKRRG